MAEVSGFELVVTVGIGFIVAVLLVAAGVFPDAGTAIVFVSMVLLGFVAVRVVRGRKYGWR